RRSRQCSLPVLRLPPQQFPLHPPPLPYRIVPILDPQLRQRILFPLTIRPVQSAQLFPHYPHRPPVPYDVVHRQQQRVTLLPCLALSPDPPPSAQSPSPQIDLPSRFLPHDSLQFPLPIFIPPQALLDQRNVALFDPPDPLHRLSTHQLERRTQGLMPLHDP